MLISSHQDGVSPVEFTEQYFICASNIFHSRIFVFFYFKIFESKKNIKKNTMSVHIPLT